MDTNHDTTTTQTFQVGQTYSARSACDYDCVWQLLVVRRTAKFVTLRDLTDGSERRVGVRVHNDAEYASPFGTYSMAPVICADRPEVAAA